MLNFMSPFMTKYTREKHEGKKNPSVNMHNRKPYRTKAQKAEARRSAYKTDGGFWRSDAHVSIHPAPKGQRAE